MIYYIKLTLFQKEKLKNLNEVSLFLMLQVFGNAGEKKNKPWET